MTFKKGDRVKILKPHNSEHEFGTIELVSGETPYGVTIDGMESMGIHKWYVDSEMELTANAPTKKAARKMDHGGVFQAIACGPWLIDQEHLKTICDIVNRTAEFSGNTEALAAKMGRPLENTRIVDKRPNGIAVVPITGPIMRYSNLFTEISGATSTQILAKDIQTAIDDPLVKGIVLNIDSPGGQAAGINELAQLIFAARSVKPIAAHIGGMGASAAYWLAAAASSISIDSASLAGSIGVVTTVQVGPQGPNKDGSRTLEFVSTQSPNKRADPTTEGGAAQVQKVVDALGQVFIDSVAQMRGTTSKKVMTDFGQGGVLVGAAAVKAGMADKIGSLESVIAGLAGSASKPQRSFSMSDHRGSITVHSTADLRTALEAGYAGEQISIATTNVDAIKAEAFAAGKAEGLEAGRKEADAKAEAAAVAATAAERARVTALLPVNGLKADAPFGKAVAEGKTAADLALAMVTEAHDKGVSLQAIANDATKTTHANPPNDTGKAGKSWDQINTTAERRM